MYAGWQLHDSFSNVLRAYSVERMMNCKICIHVIFLASVDWTMYHAIEDARSYCIAERISDYIQDMKMALNQSISREYKTFLMHCN